MSFCFILISCETVPKKVSINTKSNPNNDVQQNFLGIESFVGKTLSTLNQEYGEPSFIRTDGERIIQRFDYLQCRLFVRGDASGKIEDISIIHLEKDRNLETLSNNLCI